MNKRSLGLLLSPLLALFAGTAYADSMVVGKALADHAGNFVLDMQIDANADPTYVSDALKSNVELSSGQVKAVQIEDGIAHVSGEGATPGSEVQAMLDNEIALETGVGSSPEGTEHRRRGYWLFSGLGGLAALAGGGGGGAAAAPLEEEPAPTPTSVIPPPPPPVLPTPTPPPVLSPGP
jgi:hypothetical protein